MGRSVAEATIAVGRVRAMPFGRSRAEAAARQARLIEVEGPPEVRAYALESLVEALVWMGESEQALVPFIKLLRWWDRHPELFDAGDQNILFWEFGWIVIDLCRLPNVPEERVERTLADMERRFALANRGLERVWSCRLEWELLRGGPALEETFTTWLTLPVDDQDSCEACHSEHHADYLLETGDIAGAVAVAEAAVAAELSCSREPASMLAMLAWCHTELGHLDQVDRLLPQALAEVRGTTSMSVLVAHGRLFEVFCRGGNPARAAGLLDRIYQGLATATPYLQLETLRHLVAGTTALTPQGLDGHELAVPGVTATTMAELGAECLARAEELTAAFDARHGTTVQSERLARARAVQPTPRPWTALQQEPVAAPQQPATSATPAPADGMTTARVAADAAREDGVLDVAAGLYQQAAAEAEAAGQLAQAGWCWAEAARCAQEMGEDTTTRRGYVEAQALLKAAGVPLEEIAPLFIAWAPSVRRADYATYTELALEDYPTPARSSTERIEELLPAVFEASIVGSPLLKRYVLARAGLREAVARVMAEWGDTKDRESALVMAEEAASRFATLGRTEAAAHAWWLAGRIAAGLDHPSARTNLAMAAQAFRSTGQRNWERYRAADDDLLSYMSLNPQKKAKLARWTEGGRMGYFTKPDGQSRLDLAPLTTGRVTACLDSHNWHYEVAEEGHVGGWWDGYWFVFSFRGKSNEVFFAHAVWGRDVPVSEFTAVVLAANEWNSEHLWPMLSVRERDGQVAVLADFSVDYTFGLTDEQLDLHIRCSVDTMVSALNWMDSKFPAYVTD